MAATIQIAVWHRNAFALRREEGGKETKETRNNREERNRRTQNAKDSPGAPERPRGGVVAGGPRSFAQKK